MSEPEVDFDRLMLDMQIYQAAFRMYLEGYGQRIEDEKTQPSSLRDKSGFRQHIHKTFERSWDDYGPVRCGND